MRFRSRGRGRSRRSRSYGRRSKTRVKRRYYVSRGGIRM